MYKGNLKERKERKRRNYYTQISFVLHQTIKSNIPLSFSSSVFSFIFLSSIYTETVKGNPKSNLNFSKLIYQGNNCRHFQMVKHFKVGQGTCT